MSNSRKVYLSKSNLAYSEDIRDVKEYLLRMGYEIIEHNGGEYDVNLLSQAYTFIVVGYDMDNAPDLRTVGKGQYEQLQTRMDNDFDENYYYVGKDENNIPEFHWCETLGVTNENSWKSEYGDLYIEEDDKWIAVSGPAPRDREGNNYDPFFQNESAKDIVDQLEKELQEQLVKHDNDAVSRPIIDSDHTIVTYNHGRMHLAAINIV